MDEYKFDCYVTNEEDFNIKCANQGHQYYWQGCSLEHTITVRFPFVLETIFLVRYAYIYKKKLDFNVFSFLMGKNISEDAQQIYEKAFFPLSLPFQRQIRPIPKCKVFIF